jgi:hypothetical protein
MENVKHIGCMWALAVALGVGLGVANTPAVALAAPGDSGKGSSSDESSSRSSGNSGSASSDTPSAKGASTNDTPSRDRRTGKTEVSSSDGRQTSTTAGSSASAATTDTTPSTSTSSTEEATTPAKLDVPGWGHHPEGKGDDARGNTSTTTSPNVVPVDVPTAEVSSIASTTPSAAAPPVAATTAGPTSSSAAPAVMPAPESVVITPTPTDPPSRGVSTLINVDPRAVDNGAPSEPVQELAALTLLAGAGREFEQANTASTTVDPPADPVTNGLVTETATSAVESSAVDTGFISSTRDFFGLFSITSAGDPDDNNFVAVVFETPLFTIVLTSGSDPEDNLGFGAPSIGVAGHTVATFISPFVTFSAAIPIEDPFAELFIELIRLGLV